MKRKRSILLLALVISTFGLLLNGCSATHTQNRLPQEAEIEIRLHFHCYHCKVDWNVLRDPRNNSILYACLNGATYDELQQLVPEDLPTRLQTLQDGNLIIETDSLYYLAFCAVTGEKRDRLQQLVKKTALELLPASQQTIRQVRPHIGERQEMLYHVLWSLIMDGAAWETVKNELAKQLNKDNVSIKGIGWLMHPNHPYHCGTNTYTNLKTGNVKITWNITTALTRSSPEVIYDILKQYDVQLMQSVKTGLPITNQQACQDLAQYGLVDEKGRLTAYVIDPDSQAARIFYQQGLEFGRSAMEYLDYQKVADLLDVTPQQALVISYHELCYEILRQLAEQGLLQVPEIMSNLEAETAQSRLLVSLIVPVEPDYSPHSQ